MRLPCRKVAGSSPSFPSSHYYLSTPFIAPGNQLAERQGGKAITGRRRTLVPTFHWRFCNVLPQSIRGKVHYNPMSAIGDLDPYGVCNDVLVRSGHLRREDGVRGGLANIAFVGGTSSLIEGIQRWVVCVW